MNKTLILIGGKEKYHDILTAGYFLQNILINKGIAAHLSQDFTILEEERIYDFNLIIFYTQEKLLSKNEQTGLMKFVKSGGGFIPLHAANVINENNQQTYKKLVGSLFKYHEPFTRFKVNISENHYITKGIEDFFIEDEPYESKLISKPEKVLAQFEQNGKLHPLVYIKKIGQGKICYIALGHDGRAWYNPKFQKILFRGSRWAAGATN